MIGNNQLVLCKAEMVRAIQHYLDTVLLKDAGSVEVKDVEQDGRQNYAQCFTVSLEQAKEENP